MIDGREVASTAVVFANEIGVNFTDNDCVLRFSVQGDPSLIQSQVAMTHRTAKVLYKVLQEVIQNYERSTGSEVPFDDAKLEEIRAAILTPPKPTSPTD